MEAPVQSDQIVTAENDPIVSVENDELKRVENDQTVSIENDKSLSIDNEQKLIAEDDQSVSVVNDELASAENEQVPVVENNSVVSDENDQMASVEADQRVSVENDQIANVENNDQLASVDNDEVASVENEQVPNFENTGHLAFVEKDRTVSLQNNQLVSDENDQMISTEDAQMAAFGNAKLTNVGVEKDQTVGLDKNQLVSDENDQIVGTEDAQMATVENDESTSVVDEQMLINTNDESASVNKHQVVSLENEQVPSVENADKTASVENNKLVGSTENDKQVSIEKNQSSSVVEDQMLIVEDDRPVSVVDEQMLINTNDESASVNKDQVASLENEQVPSVENADKTASVENNQLVGSTENDKQVSIEKNQTSSVVEDQMLIVEDDRPVSVANDQVTSVENDDQLASVGKDQMVNDANDPNVSTENDQMAIVENEETANVVNNQFASNENDQMAIVEYEETTKVVNNHFVSNENDQMDCTENDQLASAENDQRASDENEHFASVENDQTISVENGQMVSFDNYQIVHDENDQMVSFDNNHLTGIENDDLANMDTDELVSMDDHHHHHHHQLVTIAENHHLEPIENNLLVVPFENNDQLETIEYNPLATIENDQLDGMETPMPKRRKKKSTVWEHFTIENVSAGCRRACCKQCKQSFAYSTGSKVAGTSHLKRHVAKGTCSVLLRNQAHISNNEINIAINNNSNINNNETPYSAPVPLKMGGGTPNGTDPPKRRYRTAASVPYMGFDPDRCRQEISRMIIMHDYPLHIVEHPGFVAFVKSLQPRFDMVSFNTVQSDCLATYMKEKQALQKAIEVIPGRICLTLDMVGSNLTTGYVFLTGSYIDTDWKLHRKLLNVVMEPYPESDSAFSHAVASSLSDWNMEGKLFTLTLNQPLSEGSIDNLRALLSIKNPLMLNGQLLVGKCLAQSLSSVALEGFKAAADTVKKVRDSVKYIKLSESREEKFLELKQQLQVPSTKSLALDDRTKWNTTFEMLLAASELREVFSCLDTSDPDYREAPTLETWKQVDTLLVFLKTLSETASHLIGSTTPTTNFYFNEVWKIELELVRALQSDDPFMSSLAKAMKERFDEYWKSCSLFLAVAVVMDPRFKMKLVEFSFSKIYGEDADTYVKLVNEGIHELYLEYLTQPLPLTSTFVESGHVQSELGLTDFDVFMMESASQQSRSELDQYLEESLLPRVHEFDVLGWWKINKTKYPTLSKMARDILTIPVCTVGPGSVFNTERREMDNYRCSLRPETVEAVICAKDWLKSAPVENLNSPLKIEFPI